MPAKLKNHLTVVFKILVRAKYFGGNATSPRNPAGSRPFAGKIKKPPDGGF